MMISTKGRYAIRLMIDLAEHQKGDFIPLREIAQRQEISVKYLEAIIKVLAQANYLQGLRGKGGGYRLTRMPEQYTIGDILRLTEGTLSPVACLSHTPMDCPRAAECRTLPMWEKLDTMVTEYFNGITLADLTFPQPDGNDYMI